jgi:cytochrome c553
MLVAACSWLGAAADARADDRDIEPRLRACAACHGDKGQAGEQGSAPAIAGKPGAYLYEQLRSFRDRRRQHVVMQQMLAFLSDDYLQEIAAYYAAQIPGETPRGEREILLASARATPP